VRQDALVMMMAFGDFVPTSRRIPLRKHNKHGCAERRFTAALTGSAHWHNVRCRVISRQMAWLCYSS